MEVQKIWVGSTKSFLHELIFPCPQKKSSKVQGHLHEILSLFSGALDTCSCIPVEDTWHMIFVRG